MTPARIGALALSLLVLLTAVWLVFIAPPGNGTPAATSIAQRPAATAVLGTSAEPGSPAPGTTADPSSTDDPSATNAPASAVPSPPPNPLAKQVPPRSVEPEELTGYEWPVRDARITGRFGPRAAALGGFIVIDGTAYHDGLDLATGCDDRVRAAHDGTVLYAGRNFDVYLGYQGNAQEIYARLEQQGRVNTLPIVVVIDDGNGYRSVYVHLNRADVGAGDLVQAGDFIGLQGDTGFSTGCHLHYGLIRMDGGWQAVVERLHPFGYPPLVRERINPLRVLQWDDQFAPQVLRDRVNPPTAEPEPTPTAVQTAGPSASTTP